MIAFHQDSDDEEQENRLEGLVVDLVAAESAWSVAHIDLYGHGLIRLAGEFVGDGVGGDFPLLGREVYQRPHNRHAGTDAFGLWDACTGRMNA
ncbi:hypothetical protein [Roseibium marinum]|uniref:hypothetical protein n=1 Tax=Roseibium marinum TaxID=281252 RepID=UPI0011AF56A6|nr:hypothetical protein [Roseibium marinum]